MVNRKFWTLYLIWSSTGLSKPTLTQNLVIVSYLKGKTNDSKGMHLTSQTLFHLSERTCDVYFRRHKRIYQLRGISHCHIVLLVAYCSKKLKKEKVISVWSAQRYIVYVWLQMGDMMSTVTGLSFLLCYSLVKNVLLFVLMFRIKVWHIRIINKTNSYIYAELFEFGAP